MILPKPSLFLPTLIMHNFTWTKTLFVLYHTLYGKFCNHLSTLVLLFFTSPYTVYIAMHFAREWMCFINVFYRYYVFFWHLLAFALYNVLKLLFLMMYSAINKCLKHKFASDFILLYTFKDSMRCWQIGIVWN